MSGQEDTTKGNAQDMLPSTSGGSQKPPKKQKKKTKLKVSDLKPLPTILCNDHICRGLEAVDIGAILNGSDAEFQEAEWGRLMNETNFLLKWDEGWVDLEGDWDDNHTELLG